ncbi:P-type conjugative transfer protein TrbL (plasmid) [Acinetobacter baumannii]
MNRSIAYNILSACLLLLVASTAHADLSDATGTSLTLLQSIKNASEQWSGVLRGYATSLFWSLALIQLVWTMAPLVFKGADFGEIVGELFNYIMVTGLFAAFLMFSVEWSNAIVESFKQAAANAAHVSVQIKPGQIFGRGVELAQAMWDSKSFFTPFNNIGLSLAGILVLLCFAFMGAFMFVTIVESYFVINAAVIFMGFGASQWTREYTLAAIRYCMSVGAKLFTLILFVGIISNLSENWLVLYKAHPDDASVLTLVGISAICCYFTKCLPELVQGIFSGASVGGGGAIGGMASAAGKATAALAGVATAGAALAAVLTKTADSAGGGKSGGDLASSLSESLGGGGPSGGPMGTGGGPTDPSGGGSGRSDPAAATAGSRFSAGPSPLPLPSQSANGSSSSNGSGSAPKSSAQIAAEQVKAGKPDNADAAMKDLAKAGLAAAKSIGGASVAVSVPGAEDAASISMPQRTVQAENEKADFSVNPVENISEPEPENVIRPASASEQTSPLGSLQVPGMKNDKGGPT